MMYNEELFQILRYFYVDNQISKFVALVM